MIVPKPFKRCGCRQGLGHRRTCAKFTLPPPAKRRKPVSHRNRKRRPPDAASAQRIAVLERDQTCAFERCTEAGKWERCDSRGPLFTCHVERRAKCTGSSIYHPDVAIAGCDECHARFDHRSPERFWNTVRVTDTVRRRARRAIDAAAVERRAAGRVAVPFWSRADRA